MIIVNLTQHEITLVSTIRNSILPASGGIARVSTTRTSRPAIVTGEGQEISVSAIVTGDVVGLPPPTDGTVFVVSAMVASAVLRRDVFSPGDLVRDAAGVVTGCRGLTSYA
jgi:hypothetical protein